MCGCFAFTVLVRPRPEMWFARHAKGCTITNEFTPVGASEADLKRLRYTAELAAKRLQARRDQLALAPVERPALT